MATRGLLDIVLMCDATGSMSTAINNVKTDMKNATEVFIKQLGTQWDVNVGVAWYRDVGDGSHDIYDNACPLTADTALIERRVQAITATGGGDTPEAQIFALYNCAFQEFITGWRQGSERYIAWFGDQYGHDPVGFQGQQINSQQCIDMLKQKGIKVIAFSMAPTNNLEGPNKQATKITSATGGSVKYNVAQDGVVRFIYDVIQGNL
ncbi:MAG: VWA domain-containing protein [Prochloron sp. SP5CPC1]|nr:VWA domain-containing protein [Candidatus Paraprochloron terpiosi SP5CPC1]